ncbi:hypothetical protein ELS24_10945 [Achromobacter spanius]|uniref:hypothetical protein n=1 Tax=Achromobacter spanius TaxID=217203 RepID=UPI000F8FBA5E|nr:hypothetical protein [Achromobacter spanius]AZS78917.1 hypothetical protein ELS24_10945 [Achromobacter spanius]
MAATPYQHRYAQPIWPADFANQPDDCLLLILRQVMLRNKLMRVNPGITQNRYFDRPRSRIGPRFTSPSHSCGARPARLRATSPLVTQTARGMQNAIQTATGAALTGYKYQA